MQSPNALCRRAVILLGLATLVAAVGCAPELGNDPPPIAMEFDPSSDPPRSPEPNVVVVNPETGMIDFGVLGTWLPETSAACQDHPDVMPVAQCEFYMYLQTLDGFPTVSPARAPVSAPLDLSTLTQPDNLFVLDQESAGILTHLSLSFRDASGYLVLENPDGWKLGHNYVIAVRGYDTGVQGAQGERVVSSSVYYLLKQAESLLTCEPDPDDAPPTPPDDQVLNGHCQWFELMLMQLGDAAAAEDTLLSLERLRQGFLEANLWEILRVVGDLPKEEVAIVWSFPIHRAPVAELNPSTGLVPRVISPTTLQLPVKGNIDPDTLVAYDLLGPSDPGRKGTVFLLNLTALSADDLAHGFPEFTVALVDGAIELTTTLPLQDGVLYGIVIATESPDDGVPRNAVTDTYGRPIVPSPVTVFLRGRGPMVDDAGHSLVSGITDEDAATAEGGRLALKALLDNPTFMIAAGLTRENIAYLYGFEYPNP